MGELFYAVHVRTGAPAAVKFLRPELAQDKDAEQRFYREARAVALLQDPGVVQVLDYDQLDLPEGRSAYLAMEYVPGETLEKVLKDNKGRLDLSRALLITRQVASVLVKAHAMAPEAVVHRDLKPANVMIVKDRECVSGTRAKLLDFGIAKVAVELVSAEGGAVTQSGISMGTPVYMAPEQFGDAKHAGRPADVYALGVMLYEMIAGRWPYVGTAVQILTAKLSQAAAPLEALESAPSEERRAVSALVARMLAIAPEERPTMKEVEEELERCRARLLHEAVMTRPAPEAQSPQTLYVPRQAVAPAAPSPAPPAALSPAPAAASSTAPAAPPRLWLPLLGAMGLGAAMAAFIVLSTQRRSGAEEAPRSQPPGAASSRSADLTLEVPPTSGGARVPQAPPAPTRDFPAPPGQRKARSDAAARPVTEACVRTEDAEVRRVLAELYKGNISKTMPPGLSLTINRDGDGVSVDAPESFGRQNVADLEGAVRNRYRGKGFPVKRVVIQCGG